MNKTYLRNSLAAICLSSSAALFSQQNVSINLSGALSPNPAILDLSDVSNAHLGFLMTNVNLASITDILTIPGPTVGMIVWNTNAALPNGVGYYYWSGTQWCYLYNTGSALGGITGTGTINYLARWTPTATTLGIGVCQDNGTTVGINIAPVATQMLTVKQATAADIAILGENTAATGTNSGTGVEGTTSQGYNSGSGNNGYGVEALNNNSTGTGVYAAGNNLGIYNFLLAGSGSSFNGNLIGDFATNSITNNTTGGACFLGQSVPAGEQIYVGNFFGGIFYKTIATGAATNSCSVPDLNGNYVCMHAPETPEAYFEDYGQGQLTNGKTHIDLDPVYAKSICVNVKHPLRVFIQLYGDCKGVYVANTTPTGFDVVELNGGTSNVSFQYHIIGNMADVKLTNGEVSKYSELRFERAPKPEPTNLSSEAPQNFQNK